MKNIIKTVVLASLISLSSISYAQTAPSNDIVVQFLTEVRDGRIQLSAPDTLTRAYKLAETLPSDHPKKQFYLVELQQEHIKLTGRKIGEREKTFNERWGLDDLNRQFNPPRERSSNPEYVCERNFSNQRETICRPR